MYGYHGQALVANLTDRSHRWEPIPEQALRAFIGGSYRGQEKVRQGMAGGG